MSGERRTLPARRYSETIELEHGGKRGMFHVTHGYYSDGTIGEIFISGGKSGTEVEANVRDTAILASLALQHGVPLETLSTALTRETDGTPSTIIGVVLERLAKGVR